MTKPTLLFDPDDKSKQTYVYVLTENGKPLKVYTKFPLHLRNELLLNGKLIIKKVIIKVNLLMILI